MVRRSIAVASVIVPPAYRDAHRQGLTRYLATGESTIIGGRIEVTALRGEGPCPERWSPVEQALFSFSETLSNRPEHAVDLLRPHFEEPQIVELVTLGSATVLLNRFATALELPS